MWRESTRKKKHGRKNMQIAIIGARGYVYAWAALWRAIFLKGFFCSRFSLVPECFQFARRMAPLLIFFVKLLISQV